MIKIKDLFDKVMGTDLELCRCVQTTKDDPEGIRFVSRTSKNNGVSAYIKPVNKAPSPGHVLSIACGGSVLSTFYQDKPFHSGRDLYYLKPKVELNKKEMLFYAYIISKNKYLYNYGRQANRTLLNISIPSKEEIPDWVYTTEINDYSDIKESKMNEQVILPSIDKWKSFKYNELFNLSRGNGGTITSAKKINGTNEFISSSSENNGISFYTGKPTTEKANTITIANNGSVGEAFYHNQEYLATSDVTVLELKNYTLTPAIAMFLITLIKQEQFKFNYGRKWGVSRMINSIIKLPIKEDQTPDWELMESYINSLPYSKYL